MILAFYEFFVADFLIKKCRGYKENGETEYRALIKYFNLKSMTSSEIHDNMGRTFSEKAPLYATVKR